MRQYPKTKYKIPKVNVLPVRGWPAGLNTLVNPNQIQDDELAEAVNVAYTQYGVLTKRLGSVLIANVGASVQGFGVYNKINTNGSVTKYFCAVAGGSFYVIDPINKAATLQAGFTFSSANRVVMVQGMNNFYIFDGQNAIVKWDGTTFTQFQQISAPTGLTVTKSGTGTGSTTYYYIVTASNNNGETIGSAEVSLASMPDPLTSTTYAQLSWTAVTGATVYNIYRSKISGDETYLTSTPSVSWNDQGQADAGQSVSIVVPSENTTSGLIFITGDVFKDSLFGVENSNKTKLWFSAGGDKIDSFSPGDGGGWLQYHPEEGEPINGVKTFAGLGKNYLYLFKSHKIGQADFGTSGALLVSDVNLAVGAESDTSLVPFENDLGFMSRYGAYTLRMEPNIVNVLRIAELSIRIHPTYINSISQASINKVCGIYDKANHVMLWSIPNGASANNTSIAFDPVYLGWSEYRGIAATAFSRFVDVNNNEANYGGDANGNIFQLFSGSNDMGTPIYFRASTKSFDMEAPYAYKFIKRFWMIFGNINALNLEVSLVQDGTILLKQFSINSGTGQTGWDVDFWDNQLWDASSGTVVNLNTRLVRKYNDINKNIISLQVIYEDTESLSYFEILGQYIIWQSSNQPPSPTSRIS